MTKLPLISPSNAALRDRSDRLIYTSVVLTALVLIPVVLLTNRGADREIQLARMALCGLWLMGALASLVLQKFGKRRAAALSILAVMWTSATGYAFYTGIGLHSAVIFLYLPAILYSSVLLGMCPAAIQTALTIAALGVMMWAEDRGLIGGIHAFVQSTTNFNFALGASVSCIALLVVAGVYERAVRESMKLLEASRHDLQAAHAEVIALNAVLERRVDERTRELEETIGDLESFNYTVAHDLRTPLRAVNGYASALLERYGTRLDAEGRRMLERIAAATLRLDALQNALLELGRIGVRPVERKRINLSQFAQRVAQSLRQSGSAEATQFDIAEELCADGDPVLTLDLIKYLMENAVKFSAGRPNPGVEFGQAITPRGPAFFLRDNGVGFNPEYRKNLFRPFQTLHPAERYKGIGIGLACARRIVERHRGSMWAVSRENGGATFYFTLAQGPDLPAIAAHS